MAEREFNEVGGIPNGTQLLRRVLLSMLQSYFSQQKAINGLTWDPDTRKTGIFITDIRPHGIEDLDPRPAIITERSAFRRQTVGLGDDRVQENLTQAIETNTWIMAGQIVFHCISRESLEAEDLAWTVHDLVIMYMRQIAAKIPLHTLGDSSIGAEQTYDLTGESAPDHPGSWVDAPVSIEFYLNRTVTTQITPVRTLDGVATSYQ